MRSRLISSAGIQNAICASQQRFAIALVGVGVQGLSCYSPSIQEERLSQGAIASYQ